MMTSPILVLQARAEARAILFAESVFDIEAAIIPLREYADRSGLTDKLGVPAIDQIIHAAFKE
jgi:hypothetical protein